MISLSKLPRTRSAAQSSEDGYSLLEILVVLVIMALLASVVAPRLFAIADRSKVTTAEAQAKGLRLALDSFRLDVGRYPTQQEGLTVLMTEPDGNLNWFGPYMEDEVPLDPWGNAYTYQAPILDSNGRALPPRVISLGADGAEGGAGDAADISS